MAGETVEAWLDGVLSSAAVMEAYIDRQELDDSFGWGALLDTMWFSEDGRRPTGSGVLLTGPDGSGKHTAAYHMIKGLLSRAYAHVFLTGEDLDGGTESAQERLQGLLDRFYDQGQALCIVLEHAQAFQNSQGVLRFLGETLCEYWLCEDYPPLFMILIASDDTPVPAPLRGRLRLCRMSLPDGNGRKAFLENRAGDLRHYVPFHTLLSQTEGMSYAELSDVVEKLRAFVDLTDGAIPEEKAAALIREQKPQPKPQPDRLQLPEMVEALIDALPQLLTDFTSQINTVRREGGPVPGPAPGPVPEPQPDNLAVERERVENLPVSILAEELFGKERVAQLLRQT